MQKLYPVILLFICLGSTTAQTFLGNINTYPERAHSKPGFQGTLKILAVMADFQEEVRSDEATTGNGKFGTMFKKDYTDTIIDPLPHNRDYFQDHLKFAQNYYRKVSKGKVNIEYTVLDSIYTAPQRMRNYSVAQKSTDFKPLGNLAKEIWTQVKSRNPSLDFAQYDIFLIFHAGVGKDVSLPTDFGDTKDLPSLYLSDKALRTMFAGDISGLPENGSMKTNTMFIPETESREVSNGFGGTSLLELSINGLIVANIASHMGLPDLFNTRTGESAIDRFGLMDGQAIFTYGGTFPPEPSPWEKIYLGWETPVTADFVNGRITLTPSQTATALDTVILKIPMSTSEYYLVEYRNRDANKDGVTITYVSGGNILTQHFSDDEKGFYYYDVNKLRGVITDVDDFNWASPEDGGIVIWHIDENIISANLESNSINNDPLKRGVDVVEADGIQQIGVTVSTLLGDVIGEAFPEDYWFKGNPGKFFKDVFGPSSRPDTRLNSGAQSLITLSNFSERGDRMSFNLKFGNDAASPALKLKMPAAESTAIAYGRISGKDIAAWISGDRLYLAGFNGALLDTLNRSPLSAESYENFSSVKPAFSEASGGFVGTYGTKVNLLKITAAGNTISASLVSADAGEQITAPPVAAASGIFVGLASGKVLEYSNELALRTTHSFTPGAAVRRLIVLPDGRIAYSADNGFYIENNRLLERNNIRSIAALKKQNGYDFVVLSSGNMVTYLNESAEFSTFTLPTSESVSAFSIGQIADDKDINILFADSSGIKAVNRAGSITNNFPYSDPDQKGFEGAPVVADISGDETPEVIAYTKDGRLAAIDAVKGEMVKGFPVSAGTGLLGSPIIAGDASHTVLLAASSNGYLNAWNLTAPAFSPVWHDAYGTTGNNPVVELNGDPVVLKEYFPAQRAYNWPNPVYENTTNIRFYVAEDSKVTVKIFDLAGGLAGELSLADAKGGMDNEIEWNVSDIQSGVYLARIEAEGISGKKGHSIIKIAVIR